MSEIKIYTTSYCSFCVQAKNLLSKLQLAYDDVNLDDKDELRMKLSQENNGYRSVPMIFIKDKFIGGFQELYALHKSGDLDKALNS